MKQRPFLKLPAITGNQLGGCVPLIVPRRTVILLTVVDSPSPSWAVELLPDPRFDGRFDTERISKTQTLSSRKRVFHTALESRCALDDVCFHIAYQLGFAIVIPTAKQTKHIWLIVHWGANPPDPVQILTEACYLTMISLTQSCKYLQLRMRYRICLNFDQVLVQLSSPRKETCKHLLTRSKGGLDSQELLISSYTVIKGW